MGDKLRKGAGSENAGKLRVVFVIGPTASGKSKKAIELAKEHDGEVISVDSRQVYRTLDIGTEKLTKEEMQGIPHHLIDIREPDEPYSAGDFVVDASRLAEELHARGKVPIFAGGTHFYFDAFLNGLPLETPPAPLLRERFDTMSDEELYEKLVAKDARRATEIDPKNRRRVIRALEIAALHGSVPKRTKNERIEVEWHVLTPDRETLRERIRARLIEALSRGLIDEVRRTRERVGDTRLNELGLEYRIIGEYIRGEREEATLLPSLASGLFDYARRQEAWLRKLRDGNF